MLELIEPDQPAADLAVQYKYHLKRMPVLRADDRGSCLAAVRVIDIFVRRRET